MNTIRAAARAALCALPLVAAVPHAAASPANVDQSLMFIQGGCSLPNAAVEVKPTPEGRLEVRITLADGQRRATTLVKQDLDIFMQKAHLALMRQTMAVNNCMDPYVSEIINTLPQLPDRPAAAPAPAAPAAPAYVPPPMQAPAPAPTPAPVRPALPATGELPVGVVNGTVAPSAAAPAPSATVAAGRVAAAVTQCKGLQGNHVTCDIKVSNRSGQDAKLIIQGANTRVMGEEGSQSAVYMVRMGEHNHYPNGNEKEMRLDLIADGSPTLQFHFYNVPEALLAIKRLEVTMGARLGTDAEMQRFVFANIPIQGR